jgi:choline dehydrogenase-like flavoprotein
MTRTHRRAEPVDFAIVGSGAAGGVLARELSQAGFYVVVLEQGPRFTLADFQHDELKNWFSAGLINDVVRNPQTFREDVGVSGLAGSGRGQPTLTIQALAFRAAEHIANFARRNEI